MPSQGRRKEAIMVKRMMVRKERGRRDKLKKESKRMGGIRVQNGATKRTLGCSQREPRRHSRQAVRLPATATGRGESWDRRPDWLG